MKRKDVTKGSCQVKKIQKSEKNSDWSDLKNPTPLSNFFFLKHVQQKTNTEKHQIFQKKDKSKLGLDPPTHFLVFLGFLDFF